MLHLLTKRSEKLICLYHKLRTSGAPISSHGFAGPLKCTTAADSNTSLWASGNRWPRPLKCHKGSIGCTWPSNAIRAGGRTPGFQNTDPESRLWNKENREGNHHQQKSFLLCHIQDLVICQAVNIVLSFSKWKFYNRQCEPFGHVWYEPTGMTRVPYMKSGLHKYNCRTLEGSNQNQNLRTTILIECSMCFNLKSYLINEIVKRVELLTIFSHCW